MNHFEALGARIGAMDETINALIKRLNLSYNHFAVLYSLAAHESCTQKQIAEEWFLPKQTVFNICKEYKEKGLLEFLDSPNDKREKILHLTELGKTHALPVLFATQKISQSAFEQLGAKKTAQLFALMDELCAIFHQSIQEYNEAK